MMNCYCLGVNTQLWKGFLFLGDCWVTLYFFSEILGHDTAPSDRYFLVPKNKPNTHAKSILLVFRYCDCCLPLILIGLSSDTPCSNGAWLGGTGVPPFRVYRTVQYFTHISNCYSIDVPHGLADGLLTNINSATWWIVEIWHSLQQKLQAQTFPLLLEKDLIYYCGLLA